MSDCIFEINQPRQSDFCRVYSNCCCSCSFKPEIIKVGQSFHKMYSNNILNFQESMTILNVSTKKSVNLLKTPMCVCVCVCVCIYPTLPSRTGCDTRSVFKQSKTGFNSEISFSYTCCSTKAKQHSLTYYLSIVEKKTKTGGFLPFLMTLVRSVTEFELGSSTPSLTIFSSPLSLSCYYVCVC